MPGPGQTASVLLPLRGRRVAVTGASGALGTALLRALHDQGAELIALTTATEPVVLQDGEGRPIALRSVVWCCGEEQQLEPLLREVEILVINHGVNVYGDRSAAAMARSLEVNALSAWRLLELFLGLGEAPAGGPCREVWVNTSEAELLPALSPLYEISKRLLGQLISLRVLDHQGENPCRIRRLVLGPFRSALNPFGVMSPGFVAGQVIAQARRGFGLIIVTPNPLTLVLVPLQMALRHVYGSLFSRAAV
ncbi:NAD-dependent epimerase/dehydratase family protein [Synechococcus sp. CS-205]|uniref:NAD-dependent epimerase/dehydratase family protein n=1 Tax=Synechococcus sp. CS-205 TaxID=2847984 RepID=UPI00223C441D|nr:NAD-dependent epimerase/dehydratase family protein [Synechococcus sp. CS-205]